MSLHAEYRLSLRGSYHVDKSEETAFPARSENWVVALSSDGVRFGISAYF
ncbi:hypothetical protein BH23BAC3_BH23BAC3_04390 [soil metagenome]